MDTRVISQGRLPVGDRPSFVWSRLTAGWLSGTSWGAIPGTPYLIFSIKYGVPGITQELRNVYSAWIDKKIESEELTRESKLTETLAVGSKTFVESIDARLGCKARGRKVIEDNGFFELREHRMPYSNDLGHKKRSVRGKIRSVI